MKREYLARLRLQWADLPVPLPEPAELAEHPFATDLDVLGPYSLHRLLDTAVSQEGSQRLCGWLLALEPDVAAIKVRQARVAELRGWPRFRERLLLRGRLVIDSPGERWPGARLLAWLQTPASSPMERSVLLVLGGLSLVTAVLWLLSQLAGWGAWWGASWVLFLVVSFSQWRQASALFQDAWFLENSLEQLQTVFDFLEQQSYEGRPEVKGLCRPLLDPVQRPSLQLKAVSRILAAASLRQNPIVWLMLNVWLPWDIYFAYRLAGVRQVLAAQLPAWLDVWFELEALSSLATYAALYPATTFPEVAVEGVLLEAEGLGHPLILRQERVNNDFAFEQLGEIAIVTGSNMAGKSSFLRALGVNVVLAYAGGTVPAARLRLGMFRLYTSMRITDSLTDGFSFFYAEVRRLRRLLAAWKVVGERPLFCLIDEIFRGTNNRERLIGSRAYVRALAGGMGWG